MIPTFTPRLIDPAADPDVVIIGAGAAGIAAARRCVRAGLSIAVLEARDRVGGRAVTVAFKDHPVDLGAHWLHAGSRNPLYKLARRSGEPLRPASKHDRSLFVGGRAANVHEEKAYGAAWDAAERAYDSFSGRDRPFAEVLPDLGPWRSAVESTEVLLSGRPLDEVSFVDQAGTELYSDNHFVEGGYGAYLARLADGLPIRLSSPVTSVDWSGRQVAVATSRGTIRGRAVIVTVPVTVLPSLRFRPGLPDETSEAVGSFRIGTYEHVILHWPDAPFAGRNSFATLLGGPHGAVGLFTHIDGTDLHYMELNHNMVEARGAGGGGRFALGVLRETFGPTAIRNCRALHATNWRDDSWSLGAWGVLPPGARRMRRVLRRPVGERIWFAGEALPGPQCSTVGGAWQHGVRAAGEVIKALGTRHSS